MPKNSAVENQHYSTEDFINLHWQDGLINKSIEKSEQMTDTTFKWHCKFSQNKEFKETRPYFLKSWSISFRKWWRGRNICFQHYLKWTQTWWSCRTWKQKSIFSLMITFSISVYSWANLLSFHQLVSIASIKLSFINCDMTMLPHFHRTSAVVPNRGVFTQEKLHNSNMTHFATGGKKISK